MKPLNPLVMNFDTPKITVLMPAYNVGKYIAEAIASVLEQSFTDFELLIINDGSTDDTADVITSFTDPRIVMIAQDNKGVSHALNTGLKYALALYIARFDADDVCYPGRLQLQYDFMINNPDYSIIGSAADYMDMEGTYLFTSTPPATHDEDIHLLASSVCPFMHPTVFYKKEAIVKAGGYNEYAYSYEDHFLWVSILKDQKACNFSQPLIKHRLNPESITIDEKWRPRKFLKIKYTSLQNKSITRAEGDQLSAIGKKQQLRRVKHGAYYALCAKKLLVNNYHPQKAREHVTKAISVSPLRLDNYLLYTVSFLPEKLVMWLYKINSGRLAQ